MSAEARGSELLLSIEAGEAPRQILEFAARGFVPLPPDELVRAVASIVTAGDPELAGLCEETFRAFEPKALIEAVASHGVRADQLDAIARRTTDPSVLEPLIRHRGVASDTLAWLAERIEPHLQDVLVTNQARLLAAPLIVERLFENPRLSSDIRRRADEFLEEFFLKKEREAMEREAAGLAEPPEEIKSSVAEDAARPADEKKDVPKALSPDEEKSLFARLSGLSVAQRIRIAYRGNKEERFFLIRDTNRLVSAAALKSPKTREADAEAIAAMRNVSEDVLRGVAFRREWVQRYSIMSALVRNPRSPIDVTLKFVPRLTQKDVKALAGDRNVPEAIRVSARRIVAQWQN